MPLTQHLSRGHTCFYDTTVIFGVVISVYCTTSILISKLIYDMYVIFNLCTSTIDLSPLICTGRDIRLISFCQIIQSLYKIWKHGIVRIHKCNIFSRVGDGAQIAAQSGIQKEVAPGARLFGSPAIDLTEYGRQAVNVRRLSGLYKKVDELAKLINTDKE